MDAELQAVRNELSKLKGQIIYTVPQHKPNRVVDIDPKGIWKKALEGDKPPVLVEWTDIFRGYKHLRTKGVADNKTEGQPFGMGSFTMPLLAELTTVEWVPKKVPRTLRYLKLKEGFSPSLRRAILARPKRHLTVLIEKDEDGYYVASVPELRGCHTQGETLDEVMENIRDAASLCLEVEQEEDEEVKLEFIGVHTIEV